MKEEPQKNPLILIPHFPSPLILPVLALIGPASQRTTWERGDGQRVDGRAGAGPGPFGRLRGAECLHSQAEPLPRAGASVDGSRDGISRPGQPKGKNSDHAIGAWKPKPALSMPLRATPARRTRGPPHEPQPSHLMPRADQAAGSRARGLKSILL